jgi:predicted nuclease of predicted toxin-antitoxin system
MVLRFLADESCDGGIVAALRSAGFDPVSVRETSLGVSDTDVIRLATGEGRILITEDKDFGQLVYASGEGHVGVVLLRYPFPLALQIATELARLIVERGESLVHGFTVVQPGRIRIHKRP